MAVALATAGASAGGFALSTSLQHHAASAVPEPSRQIGRLMVQLARQPLWLLGTLASSVAFALHAVAVHAGALVIVQPVVVSGIVLAVPVRAALDRRRTSRRDLGWVSVTAAGLGLFITVAAPSAGSSGSDPASAGWLVVVGLVAMAAAVWLSRSVRTPRRRGLLLGAAAGVGFGLASGLLKMTVQASGDDLGSLITFWPPWALLIVGAAGFALNQRSYQLAPLSMTMPMLNVTDVLVAVAFGWRVFDERPAHDVTALLIEIVALALMCLGVRQLARRADSAVRRVPPRTTRKTTSRASS